MTHFETEPNQEFKLMPLCNSLNFSNIIFGSQIKAYRVPSTDSESAHDAVCISGAEFCDQNADQTQKSEDSCHNHFPLHCFEWETSATNIYASGGILLISPWNVCAKFNDLPGSHMRMRRQVTNQNEVLVCEKLSFSWI